MRKLLPAFFVFLGCFPPFSLAQEDTAQQAKPSRHEEETVVTGSYEPIPLNESDKTVNVISIRSEQRAFRSAMDALQSEPSVDLRQRAPGIQGDLSIRGSSFGQTLVLVNGLRLSDPQTAHNSLDVPFGLEAIDRIEILQGGGSTLYGADAVGGAVNFITSAPETSEVRLGAAGGNNGTNEQFGSLAYVRRAVAERLSFTRELSTGFMPNRDYRSLATSSETNVRTGIGNTDLLLGMTDRPFGAAGFYGNYPSWERMRGWFAGVNQTLGEDTTLSFGYRRHTDLFDLYRYQPSRYENRHFTDSWQAAVRRRQEINTNSHVYYGAEGYRDTITSNNLGNHTRDRGAVYGSFDARALRRFSVNAGFREEFISGGYTAFAPSLSGGYWLSRFAKLHAGASKAFRLPTFTDLYYSDPANLGNPHLRPERAWNIEAGAEFALGRHSIDVVAFRRYDRDNIDYVRANANAPWQAANIDNLTFTGLEATLRLRLTSAQRFDIGYTALHGAQQALQGATSKYLFQYPVNAATFTWRGRAPQHIDLYLRARILDRYGRDPYGLVDFSASHAFPHVKPFIQLANVTNTGYEEIPGVRMPGRQILAGVELFVARVR